MSANRNPSPWKLASRTARMNPSAIREILKLTERPGIISLAGGLPAAETFPVEAMREATTRVLRDTPREALQYAASEGFAPLREWVAAEVGRHGLAVDAAQVLITSGSQQGLDLVGKVLIDAGSRVAVESPTYLGALQAFVPYEPEFVTVACDDEGPLPDAFAVSARGARFLYALPNFQNPSGRSIGAARRAALARAAEAIGVPIVEDNPRRALVRCSAGRAHRQPLARRHGLPRQLLEGACAGAAPRLRDRAAGDLSQAGRGQAGRRPAHAELQPADRPRGRPRRLSRCPCADHPCPLQGAA
jgi:DNA-binding transcriptional MocR family regulator